MDGSFSLNRPSALRRYKNNTRRAWDRDDLRQTADALQECHALQSLKLTLLNPVDTRYTELLLPNLNVPTLFALVICVLEVLRAPGLCTLDIVWGDVLSVLLRFVDNNPTANSSALELWPPACENFSSNDWVQLLKRYASVERLQIALYWCTPLEVRSTI